MRNAIVALLATLGMMSCGSSVETADNAASKTRAAKPRGGLAVVELFQSQGCSSCPPANRNVNAIAGRSDILALSFAVTYWDQLGWKDTFAKAEFTRRQRNYARRVNGFDVATPQVMVNGRYGLVGSRESQLAAVIAKAGTLPPGPQISRNGNILVVGAGRATQPASILYVVYDPRSIEVPISAGENTGRTLPHRNIVRGLYDLGEWNGARRQVELPAIKDASYRSAVLLQKGDGGPLIAARKL